MQEEVIIINNISIKYIFKKRKYDTKHLVVVFSGFGAKSEFTYDFLNAFQSLHANVLWIKDDFYGHCSYYLAHQGDFGIEDAVHELIYEFMSKNNLSKHEVTIVGASKGGSAALYYGIKYGFSNIVSSVPQLLIGDYVTSVWPHVGVHMLGTNASKDNFNSLIIEKVVADEQINRNIYLLTSEVDIQYKHHIAPYLKLFYKYTNFNTLFSNSILVREHNQITSHHTDILMGIISLLSVNAPPVLGCKSLSGDSPIIKNENPECIVEVKQIRLDEKILFIDGIGIIRGKEAKEYSDINYQLVLVSVDKELRIKIAKAHRPNLTKQYYNGNFCIYDKCWFTTYKYQGIDLSEIPSGNYQVFIEMAIRDYLVKVQLPYCGKTIESSIGKIEAQDQKLYLNII